MPEYINGVPLLWDEAADGGLLGQVLGDGTGSQQLLGLLAGGTGGSPLLEQEWSTYWSHELAEKFFGGNKKTKDGDPVEITDETDIFNSLEITKQSVFYTDNDRNNDYDELVDTYLFDIKVFVSQDGAKLLRAWKGAQPKPDELLVFLENNEGDLASTGQMLVKAGGNVQPQIKQYANNKNLYKWLNNIATIKRADLIDLLKSAGNKNFFMRMLGNIVDTAAKILVLPIKALAEAFMWVGKQIEKIKISDETWQKDHTGDIKKWLAEQEGEAYKKFEDFFKDMPTDGRPAQKNFEAKMPGIKQQIGDAFRTIKALVDEGMVIAVDVLFALICGVINAIIDMIAGIFILIGMLLDLVVYTLKSEAEVISNMRYYNALVMEYMDNYIQAQKQVDWGKLVENAMMQYTIFKYITLPTLLLNTSINPREIGYYVGYIGINIVICFIPIVDLVQLGKIKQLAEPLRKLFEIIFGLVNKAGRAISKTAGGLLRLFEGFVEMLRKGTEEVVNFVKRVFDAVKAWLEELLGLRKESALISEKKSVEFKEFMKKWKGKSIKELSHAEIISNLRGFTEQANKVAKLLEEGSMHVKILDEKTFRSVYLKKGGSLSDYKKYRVEAFSVGETNYFRDTKPIDKFMGELVHEGTHTIDYLFQEELLKQGQSWGDVDRVLGNRQSFEKRAYFHERAFQEAAGIEKDFETIEKMVDHINYVYPKN